jgi:hypothetical protein
MASAYSPTAPVTSSAFGSFSASPPSGSPAHSVTIQPKVGDPSRATTPVLSRCCRPGKSGAMFVARAAVHTRIAAPWLNTATVASASCSAATLARSASKRP